MRESLVATQLVVGLTFVVLLRRFCRRGDSSSTCNEASIVLRIVDCSLVRVE